MSRQERQSVTRRPWRLHKRVLPQHTDHAGVMWHGVYVAWLEEARVEALSAAGLSYAVMVGEGLEMPVVSLRIDYRQALRHGDEVVLESSCEARRGVRWPWTTRFLLGEAVMAEAIVELVMLRRAEEGGIVLRRAPQEVQAVITCLQEGELEQPSA